MPTKKQNQLTITLLKFYDKPIAKVSLELVFTILAVVVFALFAIRPTIQTMGKLIKELEDKEALYQKLNQKVAALESVSSQYQLNQERLQILDEVIPPTPRFEEALTIIEKFASEGQLTIVSLQAKEVPKEPINDVPFEQKSRVSRPIVLTVTGDYPAIRELIEKIQGVRRALIVDTVVFSVTEQRSRKVLQAAITINVPYFAEDLTKAQAAPPPAPHEP
jgi:Tfp pilus assembly protein PilO